VSEPRSLNDEQQGTHNILLVGDTGSGKTTQILTLPGKVWVYAFDPNSFTTLRLYKDERTDTLDGEEWLPDGLELDATLKGFNKGHKPDDRPASIIEPRTYVDWLTSFTERAQGDFFDDYDWVVFDSITFLQRAIFDRNAWLNNRYGKIEELGDYRIVGSKISDLFRSISSEPKNILVTGHIDVWQDELSKKVTTQLSLAGSAKKQVPLVMTNIWLAKAASEGEKIKHVIQTRPEGRGLQSIRTCLPYLKQEEDVTIHNFKSPEKYGIGHLLNGKG
jgi:energy-coupling factor transporter ATP-binding protein EcfA2